MQSYNGLLLGVAGSALAIALLMGSVSYTNQRRAEHIRDVIAPVLQSAPIRPATAVARSRIQSNNSNLVYDGAMTLVNSEYARAMRRAGWKQNKNGNWYTIPWLPLPDSVSHYIRHAAELSEIRSRVQGY